MAVEPTVTKLREWVQDQPTCMWMKRLGQYWGERVAVGECRRKVLSVSCRGYPLRVELDQQLGLSLTALSAAMTSVCTTATSRIPTEMFGTSAASLQKSGQVGSCNNPALGQEFLDLIDEAFTQHRQWRETQDASAYQNWTVGFKSRITQSIQQWIGRAGYEAGKLLRSLRDKAEQWWYFPARGATGQQPGRALPAAVTKRKVGGGSRSMPRFAQTADLLSVVQTCRRQGRSVMEF